MPFAGCEEWNARRRVVPEDEVFYARTDYKQVGCIILELHPGRPAVVPITTAAGAFGFRVSVPDTLLALRGPPFVTAAAARLVGNRALPACVRFPQPPPPPPRPLLLPLPFAIG